MEETIKIWFYIHALFGGIGLLTGLGSNVVKKGGSYHKKLGILFSYSMIISSLISLVIARMPNHKNLFLFLFGIFTIYLILAGNRALTFKNRSKKKATLLDKLISVFMLLASVIMVVEGIIGILNKYENSVLFLFFGAIGGFMTINDFLFFKNFRKNKKYWVKIHLGRMIGALIAVITAFIIAGLHIGTMFFWLAPSILGTGYIIYWKIKIGKKNVVSRI